MAVVLPTSTRNVLCNALVDLIDAGSGAGYLEFQTAGGTEVATLPFSDPAFGDASTGVATASTITDDSNATGGTIGKAAFYDSDDTEVMTVGVATSGSDININTVVVVAADTVAAGTLTVTMPAS